MGWLDSYSRSAVLSMLERIDGGALDLICEDRRHTFGDRDGERSAVLEVRDPGFFRRIVLGGDIAFSEAFVDGQWDSPDPVMVLRLGFHNLALMENGLERFSWAARTLDRVRHLRRANTIDGSRSNIAAHYDLSNAFFRLWLDPRMLYSSAYFENADSTLEQAQLEKIDRMCRKLELSPGDRVLEIGTGWGGFAIHAARRYGCRVTTTTISKSQYEYTRELIRAEGLEDRIELLLEDYRNLRGRFDRIASIEMFEAVGFRNYDAFFGSCDRLLAPHGSLAMQAILLNDQTFPAYSKRSDWIRKYIFPGAELGSLSGILASIARCTRMNLYHAEDMGAHYVRTLALWRDEFLRRSAQVRELGFDERFLRLWRHYFDSCEAGFAERQTTVMQMVFLKQRYSPRRARLEYSSTTSSIGPSACITP